MVGDSLSRALSQAEFGELVGIGQPAVSGLHRRGVLRGGVTGAEWLLAYCEHLREEAAGRAGTLAEARAALDNERRIEVAMRNAIKRGEYAPIGLIEQVLSKTGRQIAGILEGLVPAVRRRWPAIGTDTLRLFEEEIARARNLAAGINTQSLLDAADADQTT